MIRFASLGSGSGGNGLLVESGSTRLLVDCGFGFKELDRRLLRLGLAPGDLTGIVVTHEHDDHSSGVLPIAQRLDIPVWLTWGTLRALVPDEGAPSDSRVQIIDGGAPIAVGDLEVFPFSVPHDAREPVQFVFSDGAARLGVLTDIGGPTKHVADMLSGCDALVLECNHDPEMLARGPYPRWLKERIGGTMGHLANDQAAALLSAIDRSRLAHVIAAHLSTTNNTAAMACAAVATALGCSADWVSVADQDTGFDWREIR